MASRTGLPRFLYLAHLLCKLFGSYRGSILAAIEASTVATAEQKAQLIALVNAVDTACAAIDAITVVWE